MVADFDWRGAEAEGRRALALAPRDPYMQFSFAYVLASTGRVQEALALTRRALRDEPLRASWYNLLATYLVEKDSGVGAYQIAEVYALRGDANATFQWLDRAWDSRDPGISYLLFDSFILRFKDDPRFAAFCRKVGLPVPGEESGHAST